MKNKELRSNSKNTEKCVSYSVEDHVNYKQNLTSLKKEFIEKYAADIKYDKSAEDFEIVKTLGVGSFGTVLLVRDKATLDFHAMKALEKSAVMTRNFLQQLSVEKKIMESMSFPFVMTLDFCCKDNLYVYLILPHQAGGDLLGLMKKMGEFSEPVAQFYAAQVVLALEYLHHLNVVHRDVKPENIFINASGYIKLGDYGFCKIIKKRTFTLCGTPEYIAPEVILSKGYTFSVDWWSLGVLIFEMIAGYPPFYSNDRVSLYDKIVAGEYKAPYHMTPMCKSIVKSLLAVNPSKRIGAQRNGVYDIKVHDWFGDCSWEDLLHQRLTPPYTPPCEEVEDTSNFPKCPDVKLKKSAVCLYEKEFESF